MGFLSKKSIIGSPPVFAVREVPVQDWGGGGKVLVQGGSGEDRDDFELSIITGKGKNKDVNLRRMRSKLVALAVVEAPEGFEMPPGARCPRLPRMFSESDVADLARQSARDINTVFDAAQELWGLKPDDVEELAGESRPGRSDVHGIASPGNGAVLLETSSGA